MKNKCIPLLFAFALIVSNGSAQNIITLSQAINSAFDNKKNIEAGKIDITIQQLKTKALYKKYGPQVSVEYNYNYNPILQSSIIPVGLFNPSLPSDATQRIQFGTTWSQSAGITASQPILDATIKKQIAENRLQEEINRASQAQTAYDLAYEVSKSYVNIWLHQGQINAAIVDTARTGISYQLQLENYKAGRLLKSELNTAIINHNNSKQQLSDATIQLVEDKIYMMYLTGVLNGESSDFNIDTTLFNNENNTFWEVAKSPTEEMPVFQQINLQKELSLLQIQSERSKYIPVVSLKGFLGANQFSNDFNPVKPNSWFGYSYIGLNVKIPLLLAEDKKNIAQQLQLKAQQYGTQLEDMSNQYNQEAVTALLELSRLKHQLETQEENIKLYKETLYILQERYKEQQVSASDINKQESDLQKLLIDYQNTKIKAWLIRLSYINASGQLSKLWK